MSNRTRTIEVDPDEPDPAALDEAAEVLRSGGLVAFATETVYGLGADATNPEAVARIFEAKGRPAFNPLIVHAAHPSMARRCVADWPRFASVLAARFWAGPLTLVLPRSAIIPDIVTAGQATVGVRVPRPDVARRLILRAGRPIAAPSANRSTGISPTLARHVLDDLDGKIDLVLDSGQTTVGLESTVLDLTTREPRVLRPGRITVHDLERALGGTRVRESVVVEPADPFMSPGQMLVHYAPRTKAVRIDSPDRLADFPWPTRAALVVIGPQAHLAVPGSVLRFDLVTPEVAARDLYVVLHQCDEIDAEVIVVVPPPDLAGWHAIRDRIWRATSPDRR